MKKLFHTFSNLIVLSTLLVATAPLSSCASTPYPYMDNINLITTVKFLHPGDGTKVKAIINPTQELFNNLDWWISDADESIKDKIKINSDGYVTVNNDASVSEPKQFVVNACSKANNEIKSQILLYVIPYSESQFSGFLNDTIWCLNRKHEPIQKKILKTDAYTYVCAEPIDVFESDILPLPTGWTSLINFIPIIAGSEIQFMSFTLMSPYPNMSALSWDPNYNDGSLTLEIPNFNTFDSTLMFESMKVYFACDPRVSLTINFNTWQNPQQSNNAYLAYSPFEEQDEHDMYEDRDSYYRMGVFCPTKEVGTKYVDIITSIYCYKPKNEYLDADFWISSDDADPQIRNGISFDFYTNKIYRSIDHTTMYRIDIICTFDFEKFNLDDFAGKQSVVLGKLYCVDHDLYDPQLQNYLCICEFDAEWINF